MLAAVIALSTGRWRHDAVALLALLTLLLLGVIDVQAGFAGFGSPVVIALAAVYVVSAGLDRVGVAAAIGRRIVRLAGRNEVRLMLALGGVAGLLSGIMNSIGAVAVLLPAAMAAAREAQISPSKLLLPLAFGSRLGHLLTLIAGPSNLIASETLVNHGQRAFTLFEFLPLGAAFLIAGVPLVAFAGRRWLPDTPLIEPPRSAPLMDLYRLQERLAEVHIPEDSPLVSKSIAESDLGNAVDLTVISIRRGHRRILAPSRDERLKAGDTLIVQGRIDELMAAHAIEAIGLADPHGVTSPALESADVRVTEMILAPRSTLSGKTLREIGFREKYGVTVLAIWREGRPRRTGLADLPVQLGDALLVQGHRNQIRMLNREPDFLVLEPSEATGPHTARARWALLAMAAMMITSTAGLPIAIATLLAAGIVVLSGCLPVEEIYGAIDWRALVFIGALLPLGNALIMTGAAAAGVSGALDLFGRTPMPALLTLLIAGIAANQLMPSVAATVLLAPIALQIAEAVGASPHAFMLAVVAATGTTFTPISNPVNLLVMEPGGYRMSDYVRVGLPLALVVGLLGAMIIPAFWPLAR